MECGKKVLEIVTNTKESTLRTRNMDTVSLHGRAAMSIKEITNRISDAILERCTGMTVVITRENGLMEYSMEKE